MKRIFQITRALKTLLLTGVLALMSLLAGAQVGENDFTYNIGTGFNGDVLASAIDANGKLVVAGGFTSFNGTTRKYIARLNADGTLDTGFDPGNGLGAAVLSLAIQPSDGKIIVGGSIATSVARLNTNGTIDGTFALTGTGLNNYVGTVAIQPSDEKVIIGGPFTSYNGTTRNRIARLNTNGTLDTGFDPGTGFDSQVRCVAVTSGGQIVVGGNFNSFNGTARYYYAKLNSDGTLDLAFSSGAFGSTFAASSSVLDLAIQSNGQVILGGVLLAGSYYSQFARLNTNGSVEISGVTHQFKAVSSLAIQADGKIVVGGNFPNGIARFTTTGAPDPFVVGDGFTGGGSTVVTSLAKQSDGKVIAGGVFTSYNTNARNNIARLGACSNVGFTTQPTNQGICLGSTGAFSLVATGAGLTYQWQYAINSTSAYSNIANGGIYSGATTSSLTLTSPTAGSNGYYYRCIVSDAACNSTSASAVLSVNNAQAITVDPANTNACLNTSTSFTATVTGTPGGFQWQEDKGSGFVNLTNGGVYSNVTQSTLILTGVTLAMNSYKYRLLANLCTPLTSNFATLTVNEMPVINTQPVSNTGICLPNTNPISLSIAATGTALTYQWQRYNGSNTYVNLTNGVIAAGTFVAGGTYSGTTTATVTITNPTSNTASATDPALYRCVVSSGNCSVNSSLSYIYFYSVPTITTHPVDVAKCAGSGGSGVSTFSIVSPFAGGIIYQWQEKVASGSFMNITNGGVYSNVTSTTLTITGAPVGMSGNKYRCVVGNCTTPVISFDATLTIDAPPVITLQPVAASVCDGANAVFNVATTGSGVTYQWRENNGSTNTNLFNNTVYSGATSETLTVKASLSLNGYRYTCVMSSGVCTVNSDNGGSLTVKALPGIVTQPIDKTVCEGLNTIFSVSASNVPSLGYRWQVDFTGLGYVDLTESAVYQNVFGASLQIVGATTSMNGYKYRVKVGTCAPDLFSNPVTLTVNTLPTITTSPTNKTICPGENATFTVTATGTGLTYQWQRDTGNGLSNIPGGTTSTFTEAIVASSFNNYKYQCRVSGTCTPFATSTPATLTVNETKINTHPANTTACVGDSKILFVVASGASLSYQWKEDKGQGFANVVDGGIYSGATTANLGLSGLTVAMKGYKYQCVASGTCGTTPSTSTSTFATLTVNETKITNQPANVTSCVGGTASFTVINVNVSGQSLTIQWQEDKGSGFVNITNGGIYSNTTNNDLTLTGLTSAMSGYKYQCIVTTTCGAVTSSSALLTLATPAKPTVTVNATTNPEAPVLTASAGGTYEWFKDGTLVGGAQTLAVTSPGVYTVKVTTNGCTSVLSDPVAIIVTGDVDARALSSIDVYPNPGSDHVTLSLGGFEKDKPVSISIVDMQGRVMEKTSGLGQREVSIDIRNYAGGKYIAWLQQRTTKVARQFIKNDK